MARQAVTGLVPQYAKNASGDSASGYWLKFYFAGTTTPIIIYTDIEGGVGLTKCRLNTRGEPISDEFDDESIFIPYIDGDYDGYLFFTEQDADDNNTLAAQYLGRAKYLPYPEAVQADIDAVLENAAQGNITPFDAGTDYTTQDEWVEYNGSVYRPKPSALPIAAGAFDGNDWVLTTAGDASDITYTSLLTGAVLRSLSSKVSDSISAFDFGVVADGVTITTAAARAALATGKNIHFPAGEYVIDGTLDIDAFAQGITGDGLYNTIFTYKADVIGIRVREDYNFVHGIGMRAEVAQSTTSHGLVSGLQSGGKGTRASFRDFRADNFGGDGIRVYDGNLGSMHNIISIENGGHGIHMTDDAPDNNAWTFSGMLDIRSNDGNGMHIPAGGGALDANASKSHFIKSLTVQNNDGWGLWLGTRSNEITAYVEANGLGGIYIANASGAKGNTITMLEGPQPVFEDDTIDITSDANFVYHNNFDARYARALKNLFLQNQLTMERQGRTGRWALDIDESTDRKINLLGYGSGGSGWNLSMKAGSNRGDATSLCTIETDRFLGQHVPVVATFPNGDTTPDISGSNSFICANAGATTITFFDGREPGKEFTVIFDGNTTIQDGANIRLKSGSNETPANNHIKKFVCNPKNVAEFFIEIGNG